MKIALRMLVSRWKLFLGILAVYAVLNIFFAQTLAGLSVSNAKSSLDQLLHGHAKFASATTLFSYVATTSGAASGTAAIFEIVVSLAFIRALREAYDKHTPRIRDAFYEGMFPFVPFVLVLLAVGAELLPMTIGAAIYASLVNNGIAIHLAEKLLWGGVFLGLSAVSLYLIASSSMALYISTQPGMTPMRALRAGNKVTRGRRWQIVRKLLFLPLVLIIVGAFILVPAILIVPSAASFIALMVMVLALGVMHSYLFALLRSVLA